MYFKSRAEAGQKLADEIAQKYTGQPCVVVALSDGGVMIGAQIARALHCPLTMLLSSMINLPREPEAVAGITQDGSLTYNSAYSSGQLEELTGEYHSVIDQEKLTKLHELHQLSGVREVIHRDLLRDHIVILTTDGLPNGFSLEIAVQFLKPIRTKKVIIATPLASVPAVDRMHVLTDDIFCLSVVEEYINTDHYYDENDVPDHEKALEVVENIIEHWPAKPGQ